MKNPEHTIGRVIPAYDGNVSAKMVWNGHKLSEFARAADLRTKIYIKAGDAQPESNQTENLGDILAWKRIANPMELFRITLDKDGFADSEFSPSKGVANILLNHHRLTHSIRQTHAGRLDEPLFVQRCNRLVLRGIVNTLAREKMLMLGISTVSIAREALVIGTLYGFAYLGFSGFLSDILFSSPSLNYYASRHFASRVIEGMFASIALFAACELSRNMLSACPDKKPYLASLQDQLNPAKHLRDFAAGYLYLSTKGRKLVDYQA